MKAKEPYKDVSELFRQKLESAEVLPDPLVGKILMRKVSGREFLRFNPARLNIYYLGGAMAVILSASLILSSEFKKADVSVTSDLNNLEKIERTVEVVDNPVSYTVEDSSNIAIARDIPGKEKNENQQKSVIVESSQRNISSDNPHMIPANVDDSFSLSGLFADQTAKVNNLKSGFQSEGLLFDASIKEGCAPLKIKFSLKTESVDSCRWSFGDGGYSYERNPEWIFDVEGDYKVMLQVYSTSGIWSSSTTIIKVHPKPLARFEIAREGGILPDNEIRFYNYSTNGVKFRWSFGDGGTSELFEPLHYYAKSGNYNVSLLVYSDYGCSDSLTVINPFSGSDYFIDFPNAFIPNMQGPTGGFYSSTSDEVAQIFHPSSKGVSDFQLKIFSKLGILVFESYDINLGWDGYFKGQLCEPGVYIWKVRGSFRNGEPFTKMGDVTLLKN